MAAEVVTVRRVYLKPESLRKSGWHTAWYPDLSMPREPGKDQMMRSLEFFFGVAKDVPLNIYEQLASMGIATKDRPRRRDEEDD